MRRSIPRGRKFLLVATVFAASAAFVGYRAVSGSSPRLASAPADYGSTDVPADSDSSLTYIPPDDCIQPACKVTVLPRSDLGSGQHETYGLPYLYVGGAKGALKTGIYVDETDVMVPKFLNTIGAGVGCTTASGDPLDDLNSDNNGDITGRIASLIA